MELSFDCGAVGIKRKEFPGLNIIRLEAMSVSVPKSSTGIISIQPGVNVLGINLEGAVVVRPAASNKVVIVAPKSMFYVRGPLTLSALAARGEHHLQTISWHATSLPSLDQWIQFQSTERNAKGYSKRLGSKPIDPAFVNVIKRFEEAKSEGGAITEPLLLSVIFESVSRILTGDDEMHLSPLPSDLPEPLKNLAACVRKQPSGNWSLKEASDLASYSPFHFSRVFKQLVGYGFHEYVDRCRTEQAVGLLVSTDLGVDHVATQAGFGTTQGLRESVRDYLGLVPSEFRSLPEVYEPQLGVAHGQ